MTQVDKLKKLLLRKSGCTSVDIAAVLPSWTVLKKQDGRLKRYFGTAPKQFGKAKAATRANG